MNVEQPALSARVHYGFEELAEHTLIGLSVGLTAHGTPHLSFEDRGLITDTRATYRVRITDKETGRDIFLSPPFRGSPEQRRIELAFQPAEHLRLEHDHLIHLEVKREGKALRGPFEFRKEVHQVGQLDPGPYRDTARIRDFALTSGELTFTDAIPNDGKVETRYEIRLRRRALGVLWNVTVAEATVSRRELSIGADGRVRVPLSLFPGVDPRKGPLSVEVTVLRASPRLGDASPIRFQKQSKTL